MARVPGRQSSLPPLHHSTTTRCWPSVGHVPYLGCRNRTFNLPRVQRLAVLATLIIGHPPSPRRPKTLD
ncbi:hypothetical protein CH63R_12051 [Colletotrichum higginsianum IMI 349063]|uniref:Uncharacterized protein n=1 Tax=Colletotrichum higginsianum (strain IMI 349063) TaxID=759273 RepID=A0A1B7Y004_COLHI|nr:hypothetical protein CH63R_12051 [Colletotrichum higginsianum IMI 349063]OBR05348.1 hypothetical protein CH63R_12051 [Colletotrichum higginsianum IMI 349063]